MTHDKLLVEINRRLEVALYNGDPQSIHALRAVVELHSPCTGERHDGDDFEFINDPCVCVHCPDDLWPCATVQAVIKELG